MKSFRHQTAAANPTAQLELQLHCHNRKHIYEQQHND
jgi:hypothetical protein